MTQGELTQRGFTTRWMTRRSTSARPYGGGGIPTVNKEIADLKMMVGRVLYRSPCSA